MHGQHITEGVTIDGITSYKLLVVGEFEWEISGILLDIELVSSEYLLRVFIVQVGIGMTNERVQPAASTLTHQ